MCAQPHEENARKRISLFKAIVYVNGAGLALLLIVFTIHYGMQISSQKKEMKCFAKDMACQMQEPLKNMDLDKLNQITAQFSENNAIQAVFVYDNTGKMISRYFRDGNTVAVPEIPYAYECEIPTTSNRIFKYWLPVLNTQVNGASAELAGMLFVQAVF